MTQTETQNVSDEIHTCFRITCERAPDLLWGPYLSLETAIESSELLQYWEYNNRNIGTITISEWLIREYGLDYICETLKINMEDR